MSSAQPFNIHVEQRRLDRIQLRLDTYEWPAQAEGAARGQGIEAHAMRPLVERWRTQFDWREEERVLNRQAHFKARLDGAELHFVHTRASPVRPGALPVVLLHGWPSSFLEYLDGARLLADAGHDTVIVSLPGFGFSTPASFMGPRAVARLVNGLMTDVLAYPRYVSHGSDWGSIISAWLGFDFAERCAGVHMTMLSPRFIAGAATEPAEQQWLAGFRDRFEDDGAYFRLQTTRPVTLGYMLGDSPVGLLAWMAEKFAAWGDPALADQAALFAEPAQADRLLRNAMLYLVTNTAATSTWIYRGLTLEGPPGYPDKKRVEVPVAIAATRDPIFVPPPRSLVEKAYRVVRWTEFPAGGHFPAQDVPELLAADIAAFCGAL